MELTVNDYAAREAAAAEGSTQGVSPFLLSALQHLAVSELPRISADGELVQFIDHRSAVSFADYFSSCLGLATPEELDLAQTLFGALFRLSAALGVTPVLPRYSLVDGLALLRTIYRLCGDCKQTRVLEFRNSSGMVCALSALSGIRSMSVEFGQAHFLFQRRFFRAIAEYKAIRTPCEQLPWWEWSAQKVEEPAADVIICNSFLLKLPPEVLTYALSKLHGALPHNGALLCYLTEEKNFLPWYRLWDRLHFSNFKLIYLDWRQAVLVPDYGESQASALLSRLKNASSPHPLDTVVPAGHFESIFQLLDGI